MTDPTQDPVGDEGTDRDTLVQAEPPVAHDAVDHPDATEAPEAPEPPERAATQLSVLPTPVPGPTGVPAVDEALDRLSELGDLDADPEQHVAVLEDVQSRLQAALTGPDASAS